ncbi:hypothetical protein TEA_001691 [Camellia sinensis var. sinensis]|uniref:Uncharacterized protein n=1 Tax=Camellia sinensis var. sinensis TaxID=542762 RepID=A0A4S4DB46_CAMSN|nr:hypothetical protein TEA_001691 [Camellia sinensis var. sinensis]
MHANYLLLYYNAMLRRLVDATSFAMPDLVLTTHIMLSIWGYGGHCAHRSVPTMIAFIRTLSTPSALLMAMNRSSPRIPSKSRGKAITATQQQPVHKCQFDSDNTKLFLQLVIAEMEMNNRCAKFKTKPLEHVDLIERVYSGATATGKHAWTPTEVCNDDAAATNANEDSGMGPLTESDNTVGDCLARLMNTPGLEPGDKLFSFACGIMDSPNNQDIIMALLVNYIVNWLTKKRTCTPTNVGRDRKRGTQLFKSNGAVDLD